MFRPALILTVCCSAATVSSQTAASDQPNAWTNSTSGNWEDMHWSLGVQPGPGQSIQLTNTGWKAVCIRPNTAANFAQTLNPSSIYLGGYTDSFNLLLLNYAGFSVPLSVSSLVIGTNSGLTALGSALSVNNGTGGPFSIGGVLNQGENAAVSTTNLTVGDVGPGAYNMTNGALLVSGVQTVGGNFPSTFRQFGGTNYAMKVALLSGGEYDLYGGNLTTSNLIYRAGSGAFNQYGGVVKPDRMYVTMTTYVQAGGIFSCGDVELPGVTSQYDYAAFAFFTQSGGTNNTTVLSVGNYYPPFFNASAFGGYTLSDGVLNTSSTSIGPWGRFTQSAGAHTSGGVSLHGTEIYIGAASWASYNMSGGTLNTPGIGLSIGSFTQTGGSNLISGNLNVNWATWYNSSYNLSGGVLGTSNTTVVGTTTGGGGFAQSGGTQIVSNLLTISRSASTSSGYVHPNFVDFLLNGGELIAPNIRIDSGAFFHHRSGALTSAGTVTLADGNWEAYATKQQLGTLILGQGTNSSILLPEGVSALWFLNSSGAAWSSPALLTIEGWNGSLAGGGAHQISFGSNNSGLTPSQVAQIRFHNPGGSTGYYPATMLNTGEIVPSRFIATSQGGRQISWAPGMTLQSSTNVNGPYFDVSGATSPYTPTFSGPQKFFRLRQ